MAVKLPSLLILVRGPCVYLNPGSNFDSARFSPDDKFSRHRVTIKKRYNVLPTQLPAKPL